METETKKRPENVVAGVVGAFLGSLLGVVCTVAIGQLGYVASVSGLRHDDQRGCVRHGEGL